MRLGFLLVTVFAFLSVNAKADIFSEIKECRNFKGFEFNQEKCMDVVMLNFLLNSPRQSLVGPIVNGCKTLSATEYPGWKGLTDTLSGNYANHDVQTVGECYLRAAGFMEKNKETKFSNSLQAKLFNEICFMLPTSRFSNLDTATRRLSCYKVNFQRASDKAEILTFQKQLTDIEDKCVQYAFENRDHKLSLSESLFVKETECIHQNLDTLQ